MSDVIPSKLSKSLSQMKHNQIVESMVDTICARVQNSDRTYFRGLVTYYMGKVAGSMWATVRSRHLGDTLANVYFVGLASSGYGKGYSVTLMEDYFLDGFIDRFMRDTYPMIGELNMRKKASELAAKKETDEKDEFNQLRFELQRSGSYAFDFDSGSVPALKQMRNAVLIPGIGAVNFQVDEIGMNLRDNAVFEMLKAYLELYDNGRIKTKLTKESNDSSRGPWLDGKTPSNMFLGGTPVRLFDGGELENTFYDLLANGYARRSIFALGNQKKDHLSDDDHAAAYYALIQPQNTQAFDLWNSHFTELANPDRFNWISELSDDVGIEWMAYKFWCEKRGTQFSEHKATEEAEMSHRASKALKIAGCYAFCEGSSTLEMEHLHAAIKLVEECGKSFTQIMNRKPGYQKLAEFLATHEGEITVAELQDRLPFYRGSQAARADMMTLAQSWGHPRHLLIRKRFRDTIEFYSGETLKQTDLNQISISYSNDYAENYTPVVAPLKDFDQLVLAPDLHWCNHSFQDNHRQEKNTIPGFNLVVLDLDSHLPLETVHELLADYTFATYTTKRHTPQHHRYRVMMPTNYVLNLDEQDYKEFMNNVSKWVPFRCDVTAKGHADTAANQRSRKWLTNPNGIWHFNQGTQLLDAYTFLPRTKKNEEFTKEIKRLKNLSNLERWFVEHTYDGTRNNNIFRYAMALVSSGMSYIEVEQRVLSFNASLEDRLDPAELQRTVLTTASQRVLDRDQDMAAA